MKYRLLNESNDEIVVIMEDGGVASISKADECENDGTIAITEYYQARINEDTDPDEVWEELGEGKCYHNQWTKEMCDNHLDKRLVQDALEWLAVGETYERDDSIWTSIF